MCFGLLDAVEVETGLKTGVVLAESVWIVVPAASKIVCVFGILDAVEVKTGLKTGAVFAESVWIVVPAASK